MEGKDCCWLPCIHRQGQSMQLPQQPSQALCWCRVVSLRITHSINCRWSARGNFAAVLISDRWCAGCSSVMMAVVCGRPALVFLTLTQPTQLVGTKRHI